MSARQVAVIKLGSNALSDAAGRIDEMFLDDVARQLVAVKAAGITPVVVSSGAVSSGMARLGLAKKPDSMPERQALAAIGQAGLMHRWQVALGNHGLVAAQVLLTADAFDRRERYLNLTNTFAALCEYGAVPIINENDTVAIEELTVGDNDRLSALVASQLGAKTLLLLTDIDGYFDADPRQNPQAKLVPVIAAVTPRILEAAGGSGARGRGGMRSKLVAAALAANAGVETVIAKARVPRVIERVLDGEVLGTRIQARPEAAGSRQRWLALVRTIKGAVRVDAGAAKALVKDGRSLLPAGITAVEGRFKRGDTIAIRDAAGTDLARGIADLSAEELETIQGLKMDAAARRLGYALPKAAVHRDNLMLVE